MLSSQLTSFMSYRNSQFKNSRFCHSSRSTRRTLSISVFDRYNTGSYKTRYKLKSEINCCPTSFLLFSTLIFTNQVHSFGINAANAYRQTDRQTDSSAIAQYEKWFPNFLHLHQSQSSRRADNRRSEQEKIFLYGINGIRVRALFVRTIHKLFLSKRRKGHFETAT